MFNVVLVFVGQVLDAVQPYLAKLEAQNSLLEAMETMN